MKQRYFLCFLWTALLLRGDILVAAEADPAILNGADLPHLQQGRIVNDPRPRLSASQQVQILSDVQQHQQRYRQRPAQDFKNPRVNFPTFEQAQSSTPFSSLAKYKVDRAKQQLQQLQQQQQQVQQLLQQQQQKIAQQLGTSNFVNGGEGGIQSPQFQRQQYLQQQQYNQYNQNGFQNLQQDLSQPLFSDQQTIQLQEYIEKQRELELLQKQRQQLLYEQQELRRQQELLRLQQLQRLTSTTPPPPTTTSTPITISTTSVPLLLSSPTARRITPSEADLFLKAIANHQKKYTTTAASTTATATTTTTTQPPPPARRLITSNTHRETDIPENLLSLVQEQESRLLQQGKSKPQIKIIYQTEKPSTTRQNSGGRSRSSSQLSERELLLKQLKLALAQSGDDDDVARNVTTRDLILPNGKKIQVIHAPNGLSSISPSGSSTVLTSAVPSSTTTIKPPKALFEELTKDGVLPPGADFEVIRQKSDGKLEEVGKTPIIQNLPAKKVTFVLLEEQPDGSYKVQGVKGNANDKESGGDVESIVEKIKKGELKLPPSSLGPTTQSSTLEHLESNLDPNLIVSTGTSRTSVPSVHSVSSTAATFRPTTIRSTSTRYSEGKSTTTEYVPYVTVSPNSVFTTDKYVTSASSVTGHVYNALNPSPTKTTLSDHIPRVTTKYSSSTRSQFIPTMAPVNEIVTTTATIPTSYSHHTPNSYVYFSKHSPPETSSTSTEEAVKPQTFQENLAALLKREGLYAMAKYLRQSGLDSVLNETGPYTIFVPTDKAFRTLLVQLGGPEKAEQKFHDNPRLLSGLLLHHVIPGAFRIDSLQDEMTGVSLAGTQLRVNEYAMQDHEWNDVTTINGARVAPNKRDIEIPQGIAHAVDRVMFPLPVGDLVQTLQADRERRFTTFLRMLHVSGLEDTLTGPKTFTIFAPTDSAFTDASSKNGVPIWTDEDGPEAAKAIISRHVIPTTLYTAGMRYYIQKDTLRPQSPVHIHKNGGRVRINEAHVVTHNVPATNGVLHALDGVL
ncbi:PREDICTED: uncharacterized protein LOC108770586 isoform X2 [Trachymyrmex cornetzi]|uniref:uncharacterized protein LOC108770586 isoform X2 n=1 Tax=Trachymyrmex cornetzi TaxID=471704 RepID=UPI00084F454A|nr:PREDICTED: uncharacterized protein LOC108770586 isoform X2 [Trachymyrmex cornetzi]